MCFGIGVIYRENPLGRLELARVLFKCTVSNDPSLSALPQAFLHPHGDTMAYPTNDVRLITKAAVQAIDYLFRPGYRYSKADVLLMDLRRSGKSRITYLTSCSRWPPTS
jgi:hypothetical protein